MQLLLIDDHLNLIPETGERSAGDITMVIEVTDDALGRSITIYPSHNPKDGLVSKCRIWSLFSRQAA
jgi:hypothetical protein